MDHKRGEGVMLPRCCISGYVGAVAASDPLRVLLRLCPVLLCALLLSGCLQSPVPPYPEYRRTAGPPKPSEVIVRRVAYFYGARTIHHEVGPGETISLVARMYGVSPESICRENGLRPNEALRSGQILTIRDVRSVRYVLYLYRTRPWSYIIIHHTATYDGDATTIQWAHLARGFWNGLGYDFVIDNGTLGKGDGVIEMSPRWLRQEDGAHCKADDMNQRGIGIALVGNFDRDRPTRYQLESLAYLIFILRHYYHIPPSHVMGHGQVPGARTDCPGKLFPMNFLRWAAQR